MVLRMLGSGRPVSSAQRCHRDPPPPPPAPPPQSLLDPHVRTINMSRGPPDSGHGFGICVKGGTRDTGVYISRVEEGSVAERAGLRPGDSILQVNGTPFTSISHEDALKVLKACRELSITVRSSVPFVQQPPPLPPPMQPPLQTYTWVDRKGRPVSPPPRFRQYHRDKLRKVELIVDPGQSLGLMIRGGIEYNLGIFVTGVDKDSVAERAGLLQELSFLCLTQIGDQILEVNGQSFLEVTHDEAVSQLKCHKRMVIKVCDVGKIPHSCSTLDMHWPDTPHRCCVAALQMVDEKHTLFTELRELIAMEDRARFDELVYRREPYSSREVSGSQGHNNNYDANMDFGRSGDDPLNSQESREDPSNLGTSSNTQSQAQVIPDEAGNLRIIVRKTKPLLGIAIEGGANTRHPLPRIININENGAAFDAGGLQVGQLILEVDGHKVEGMHHQEVARLIAESFAQRDKPHIEFLVVEAKKSNLEPKPTALIFLEA
uniref:PDZ domain-containing protein n=1 Tax=Rhodnius prolixus TaxID=13249 RepID=T1HCQ1_RHOPR